MKESYKRYLRTEHWIEFRNAMLQEKPDCEMCGEQSTCVHHMNYDNLGDETEDDVMCLCKGCHAEMHEMDSD